LPPTTSCTSTPLLTKRPRTFSLCNEPPVSLFSHDVPLSPAFSYLLPTETLPRISRSQSSHLATCTGPRGTKLFVLGPAEVNCGPQKSSGSALCRLRTKVQLLNVCSFRLWAGTGSPEVARAAETRYCRRCMWSRQPRAARGQESALNCLLAASNLPPSIIHGPACNERNLFRARHTLQPGTLTRSTALVDRAAVSDHSGRLSA
jgi:hypothetical protein